MAEQQFQPPRSSAEVPDLTGRTVGRFAIRRRLGSGGMGEVYRAEDTKLKRPVALKRMGPLVRDDEQARGTLLKEAERVSSLADQHIAGLYDVLEEKGEIFLVMEYVEGATLREHLRKSIQIRDFLNIAVQCVEGLAAAHEKGIVHRDLKPENIMLTSTGRVKILDFGVARRLPRARQVVTADSVENQPSGQAGTPAYMAPETLLEREPDARTDVFSLGVVFYEALARQHPFLAAGFVATTDRILHEQPKPLTEVNPSVPPELDRIIARMMAKDPDRRYTRAIDVLADLRALQVGAAETALAVALPRRRTLESWPVALFVVGLILLAGAALTLPSLRRRFRNWTTPAPQARALAVLPFQTVGGGPESQAFGQGLSETLSAKLNQLAITHALEVIPSSEVRAQGVTTVDKALRLLGANLVLEGSLHSSGGSTRVAYSLVDARSHRVVTADTVTVKAADTFMVEDRVVGRVLENLAIELRPGEQRVLAAHGTDQPGAYDFYLQGRGYLQDSQKPENVESAVTVFNSALKLDPRYALAYAGLGEAYWRKFEQSKNNEWIGRATAACQQAVSLEAGLAAGHSCLGLVENGTGHYEKAAEEYGQAVRLEPASDQALRGLASADEQLSKADEAEKTFRQAISLRPHYWAGYDALGAFLYGQGRYSEAAAAFAEIIALAPDNFVGYSNLGGVYIHLGRYAEAISAFQRSAAIRPTATAYANLATAYFYLRRYAEAARTYEQALGLEQRNYMIWGNLGDAYYWSPGKRAQAADAYRKAVGLADQQVKVNARDATVMGYLASYHAMLGERQPAASVIRQAVELAPRDPEVLFNAALVYNQLGQVDRTLDFLSRALAAGFSPTTVRNTPNLEALSRKPQLQALMKKY